MRQRQFVKPAKSSGSSKRSRGPAGPSQVQHSESIDNKETLKAPSVPGLHQEPHIESIHFKQASERFLAPSVVVLEKEVNVKQIETVGMERKIVASQTGPTPLTEYTNSYLGIDVVLHQNKMKKALAGQRSLQLITPPPIDNGRSSGTALAPLGHVQTGRLEERLPDAQRRGATAHLPNVGTKERHANDRRTDSNFFSYRDSSQQPPYHRGASSSALRAYASSGFGPASRATSANLDALPDPRAFSYKHSAYQSAENLPQAFRSDTGPLHMNQPTPFEAKVLPHNSALKRFQELQAKSLQREAAQAKENEKVLQQYLKLTDPDAKFAMKMMKRLRRKQLQQEALSRGYLILNKKQALVSQRRMEKIGKRVNEQQWLLRKHQPEATQQRPSGTEEQQSTKQTIVSRMEHVLPDEDTDRKHLAVTASPAKSASSKMLNDLTERQEIHTTLGKGSTILLHKKQAHSDQREDHDGDQISMANVNDGQRGTINERIDPLQTKEEERAQSSTQVLSKRSRGERLNSKSASWRNFNSHSSRGPEGAYDMYINKDIEGVAHPEVTSTVHIQDQSAADQLVVLPEPTTKKLRDAMRPNAEQQLLLFTNETSSVSEGNTYNQAYYLSSAGRQAEVKVAPKEQAGISLSRQTRLSQANAGSRAMAESANPQKQDIEDSYQMHMAIAHHSANFFNQHDPEAHGKSPSLDGMKIRVQEQPTDAAAVATFAKLLDAHVEGQAQDSRTQQFYQIITDGKQSQDGSIDNKDNQSLFSVNHNCQGESKGQQTFNRDASQRASAASGTPNHCSPRSGPRPQHPIYHQMQDQSFFTPNQGFPQNPVEDGMAEMTDQAVAALVDELPPEALQLFYQEYRKQFSTQRSEDDMLRSLANMLSQEPVGFNMSRIQEIAKARGPLYGKQLAKKLQRQQHEVKIPLVEEKLPVFGNSKKTSLQSRHSSLRDSQERGTYRKHSQHLENLAHKQTKLSQSAAQTIKLKSQLSSMARVQTKLAKGNTLSQSIDKIHNNVNLSMSKEAVLESKFNTRKSAFGNKDPQFNCSSKAASISPGQSKASSIDRELVRPQTQASMLQMKEFKDLIESRPTPPARKDRNFQTATCKFGKVNEAVAKIPKTGLNVQKFQQQRIKMKNVENQKLFNLVQNRSMANIRKRAVSPLVGSVDNKRPGGWAGPYQDNLDVNDVINFHTSLNGQRQFVRNGSSFLPKSSIWSQQIKQVRLSQSRLEPESNFQGMVRNSFIGRVKAEPVAATSQTSEEPRYLDGAATRIDASNTNNQKKVLECEIPAPSITQHTAGTKSVGLLNPQTSSVLRIDMSDKSISLNSNLKFVQLKTANESIESSSRPMHTQIHVENQKNQSSSKQGHQKLNLPLTMQTSLQQRPSREADQKFKTNRLQISNEQVLSNHNRDGSSGHDSVPKTANYYKDAAKDANKGGSPYFSNKNKQQFSDFGVGTAYRKNFIDSRPNSKPTTQKRRQEDPEGDATPPPFVGTSTPASRMNNRATGGLVEVRSQNLHAKPSLSKIDQAMQKSGRQPAGEGGSGNNNNRNVEEKEQMNDSSNMRRAVFSSSFEKTQPADQVKASRRGLREQDAPSQSYKGVYKTEKRAASRQKIRDYEFQDPSNNDTGMIDSENMIMQSGKTDKKVETGQRLTGSMLSQDDKDDNYQISPNSQFKPLGQESTNPRLAASFAINKNTSMANADPTRAASSKQQNRKGGPTDLINLIFMKQEPPKPSTSSRNSFHSKSSPQERYRHLGLLKSKSNRISNIHSQKYSNGDRSRPTSIRHANGSATNRDPSKGLSARPTESKKSKMVQSSRGDRHSSNNDLNNIMTPLERGLPAEQRPETLKGSKGGTSGRQSHRARQTHSQENHEANVSSYHLMSRQITPDGPPRQMDTPVTGHDVYEDHRKSAPRAAQQVAANLRTVYSSNDLQKAQDQPEKPPIVKLKTSQSILRNKKVSGLSIGMQSAQQRINARNRNVKKAQITTEERPQSQDRKGDARIKRGSTRNFGEKLARTFSQSQSGTRNDQGDASTLENRSPGRSKHAPGEEPPEALEQKFTPIQIKNMRITKPPNVVSVGSNAVIGNSSASRNAGIPKSTHGITTLSSNRNRVIMQVLQKRHDPEGSLVVVKAELSAPADGDREHSKDSLTNDMYHLVSHRNLNAPNPANAASAKVARQADNEAVQFQQLHQIQYPVNASAVEARNNLTQAATQMGTQIGTQRGRSAKEGSSQPKVNSDVQLSGKAPRLSRQAPLAPLIGQAVDRGACDEIPMIVGQQRKLVRKAQKASTKKSKRRMSSVAVDTEPMQSDQLLHLGSHRVQEVLEVDESVAPEDRAGAEKVPQPQQLGKKRQSLHDAVSKVRILHDSKAARPTRHPRSSTLSGFSKDHQQRRLRPVEGLLAVDQRKHRPAGDRHNLEPGANHSIGDLLRPSDDGQTKPANQHQESAATLRKQAGGDDLLFLTVPDAPDLRAERPSRFSNQASPPRISRAHSKEQYLHQPQSGSNLMASDLSMNKIMHAHMYRDTYAKKHTKMASKLSHELPTPSDKIETQNSLSLESMPNNTKYSIQVRIQQQGRETNSIDTIQHLGVIGRKVPH